MRFYVPKIKENATRIILTDEAHNHAAYVLRIRTGDLLTIFDGSGVDYLCKVTEIKKDETSLEVLDTAMGTGETKTDITLYLSVIKQDRFELAVQKVTELGVKRVVPVYATYSQRNCVLNQNRLNKIAASACEQCGRSVVPVIEQPIEFDELIKRAQNTYLLFPWEREVHNRLRDSLPDGENSISVFVGPEGGITESEKDRLVEAGAKCVTLGKRILRAETAAIVTLSVINYETGECDL